MPKVSVFLPSYNHAQWIGEAIESVLQQTFTDLELVIVDDGSTDNSAEVIKKYAARDSRIKYEIFQKNKGAINTFKRCYELSTGELIAYISSDDIWHLDKLQVQTDFLAANPQYDALFGMAEFIDQDGNPLHFVSSEFKPSLEPQTKYEWMNYFFTRGNCVCHPTMLIKRQCYEDVGFYKPTFRSLPDFEMWTRLFYLKNIKVMNKTMIKFRRHTYNESVGNKLAKIRRKTERKQICHNFLEVKTVAELEKIFPKENFPVKEDILTPFYWAMLALEQNTPFKADFAFDVLYRELEKPEVYTLLERNNLYSHTRLAEDVVKHDIYHHRKRGQQKIFPWLRKKLRRLKGLF